MEFAVGQDIVLKGFIQRCQQTTTRIHPARQYRTTQHYTLAGMNLRLAIQRYVLCIL